MLSFFPLDVLDDLIESVSEDFLTYSTICYAVLVMASGGHFGWPITKENIKFLAFLEDRSDIILYQIHSESFENCLFMFYYV